MHIWTIEKWRKVVPASCIHSRSCICIRADKDVDEDLKNACRRFVRWVKKEYYFPLPLCVYLRNVKFLKTADSDIAVGTFFEPDSFSVHSHIRIAAGDYDELIAASNRDDAITSILLVIAHEMTHYFQWINALALTPRGCERQANQYARFVLAEYAETCEHP